MKRLLKWLADLLENVEEEYQLNVVDCHPFEGTPPISLEEYKEWKYK